MAWESDCPRCGRSHNPDATRCDTEQVFVKKQHTSVLRHEADRAEDATVHAYEDAAAEHGDVIREAERQAAARRLDAALRALARRDHGRADPTHSPKQPTTP